jgi:hypothetical protein
MVHSAREEINHRLVRLKLQTPIPKDWLVALLPDAIKVTRPDGRTVFFPRGFNPSQNLAAAILLMEK